MQTHSHTLIDIPFSSRYTCWFCGEPSGATLHFPRSAEPNFHLEHAFLAIPACNECHLIDYPDHLSSIWGLRSCIRQALISLYTPHLAIGENWTEQEIQDSDFSGAILGGFGKSAWRMYEIAKQRVAFQGWLVSVDGLPLDIIDDTSDFEFDGTHYSSLKTCIDFFADATNIDKDLLTQLVDIVTPSRFNYALKIAKLNKRISHAKRTKIIDDISLQEAEKREADIARNAKNAVNSLIVDVCVCGTVAPIFAIEWAMEKGAHTLPDLCHLEDDYFDEFEHLGGAAAFSSYNGLQLYLKAREDAAWIKANDPNKDLWLKKSI